MACAAGHAVQRIWRALPSCRDHPVVASHRWLVLSATQIALRAAGRFLFPPERIFSTNCLLPVGAVAHIQAQLHFSRTTLLAQNYRSHARMLPALHAPPPAPIRGGRHRGASAWCPHDWLASRKDACHGLPGNSLHHAERKFRLSSTGPCSMWNSK